MPSRTRSLARPTLPAIGLGLALCVLWLAAGAGLRAAPPTPAGGTFSETTEVTVVQVPVQVVRDGEPVRGLTVADFEVYDGRRRQKVTGFEVLDLAARQGPAVASIAPALRRHFLFLFDLSFSEPKSLLKARDMVSGMLPTLHPSDLVAVATYSSANGPRIALGFTSDRRQVLKAVDHLGLPQLVDRNPDPLNLVAAELREQLERGVHSSRVQAELENAQDSARLADRANREQQAAVVNALARSFTDLARLLAGVRGRKEVIYLSEGFDTSLLLGTENQKEQEEMSDLSMHGEGFMVDSEKRYGETRGANVLEKMMEEFRRSDCIIQAVDIGGVRSAGTALARQGGEAPTRPSGEGSLFAMAHDTGGELYRNFNDLGSAMGQVLKKTSITYVLTFQPDEVKSDGAYHKLRVELKNGRGAQLFFRPGYYAPRPYGKQSATEKTLATAENVVGGGDSGAVGTAVLVAAFRPAGSVGVASGSGADRPAGALQEVPAMAAAPADEMQGTGRTAAAEKPAPVKAYVPVVIEADGASLISGTQGDALPAEIYTYAIDSSGSIQDFFTQSLRFELAKVAPALRQSGIKFFGHLDLPPGEYNVRVLVRNGATGAYGLRSQPLVVPAFAQLAPVLLPPFFPEAPGRWLMVREAPRGQKKQAPPYPFVVQERAYIPSSRPVLAAGQEAAVALVGYNLPAGGLKAQARVLAADGKDLGEGDLKIARRENPDAEGEDRLTATFRPPRGLEPGEYQLVIVLTDAQGVAHNSATHFVVAAPGQGARG
jgi:VWFA-related protein